MGGSHSQLPGKGIFHVQQVAVKLPPLRLVDRSELNTGQFEVMCVHACDGRAWVPQSVLVQPGFPPVFRHSQGLPMGYPRPQHLLHRAIAASKGDRLQLLCCFPDMVIHYICMSIQDAWVHNQAPALRAMLQDQACATHDRNAPRLPHLLCGYIRC